MKTSLDLLNAIQIPKPCPANWGDMIGDDFSRYCGICEKHVYNLSALSADEAAALVREKEGQLCVRLYRRVDGTTMTSDCQPPTARGLAKHLATATALATSLFVAGCSDPAEHTQGQPQPEPEPTKIEPLNCMVGEPAIMGKIDPGPMPLMGSPAPQVAPPADNDVLKIPPRDVPPPANANAQK